MHIPRNSSATKFSSLIQVLLLILLTGPGVNSRPDPNLSPAASESESESEKIQPEPHAEPPTKWREHWFEHNLEVSRVFLDEHVAVYYDADVIPSITWPNGYLSKVWRYVKETYGHFGPDSQLYAIFHAGKYSGGHPSTYFDDHHDFRNVIDIGDNNPEAWMSGQGYDLDIATHEVAHIVEIGSKGVHGSPAFNLWGDSKWAEIFIYDVYVNLGMSQDVTRAYNNCINTRDNYPRENTYWFRNWFYPIYTSFGGNRVLNNFFQVLAANYRRDGTEYRGELNMGQFVHFWSGAAGRNLKSLAEGAFGWSQSYQQQFDEARNEFPNVNYS